MLPLFQKEALYQEHLKPGDGPFLLFLIQGMEGWEIDRQYAPASSTFPLVQKKKQSLGVVNVVLFRVKS